MCLAEIPKFMFTAGIWSLLLAKKSCDIWDSGYGLSFVLPPMPATSSANTCCISLVKRQVARALCFDDLSAPVTESFEYTTAPKVTLNRDRKQKNTILVDTEFVVVHVSVLYVKATVMCQAVALASLNVRTGLLAI